MKAAEGIQQDWNALVDEALRDINDFSKGGRSRDEIFKKLQKSNTPDQVIDEAFKQYLEKVACLSGAHVLKDKKSSEKMRWYKPTLEPDENSRWGKLRKVLQSKSWTADHISDLDNQSNSVVSNLMAPNGAPGIVKGLVLGYVQSGKTANFSATIAKACDEKYKIIIVLAGTHNSLRAQTEKRLEAELIVPHGGRNAFRLTNTNEDGDFKAPPTPVNSFLTSEGKIIFSVLKKNTTVLRKFKSWIMEADTEILKHSPVLIIDDEADQASLNESRNDRERTATNKLIVELLQFFGKNAPTSYVGYTATPFANILLDANDEEDLFPRDFIVALKAPETYVGAERLFGRVGLDGDISPPLDLIRNIEVAETVDSDDVAGVKVTQSLEVAIHTFLLAGAERIRRAQALNKAEIAKDVTMLVHTSQLTDDHCDLTSEIDGHLRIIKAKFAARDSSLKITLEKIWKEDFVRLNSSTTFRNIEMGTFSDAWDCLEIFLNEIKVVEINSKSKDAISFTDEKTWAIIVGGNKLSRGLTIEGLTVSYFHRTSKGYDTLLQMGRWFGYRPNYLDLTRIFVTSEMEANFHHLATVENDLREDIERMVENGETPLDMALRVRAHDELEITLKQSRRNATISSTTFSGQKISTTLARLDDLAWAKKNADAVKRLVNDLDKAGFREPVSFMEFRNCLLFKDVPRKQSYSS
ncbi:MAG: Z1 domain-containing protein [Bdellovibrionales bacterium]|nr:Z1 domain-containing protein [Bdellovibrionales bacterium]